MHLETALNIAMAFGDYKSLNGEVGVPLRLEAIFLPLIEVDIVCFNFQDHS